MVVATGCLLLHGIGPSVIKCFKDHVNGGSSILKVRLCDFPGLISDDLHDIVLMGIFIGVLVGVVMEFHVKAHLPLLPLRGHARFPDS